MNEELERLGDELDEARIRRVAVEPLRERFPAMTIEDAYGVQTHMVARRVSAREHVVGKKIGATSKAVQERLGVTEPTFGQLTSGMLITHGDTIFLGAFIQPLAEAELAFVLKKDLRGPGITALDVIHATDYVSPCFEIVDSRILNWDIRTVDTIADNASCGAFVLGGTRANPREIDFALAGVVMDKNDELVGTGVGAAVRGSPVNTVVWLANTLGRLGTPLEAGEIILSGSPTPLVEVQDGDDLVCTVGGIGTCKVHFSGRPAAWQ